MINKVRLDQYEQPHYSRGRNGLIVLLWWFVQGTVFRFSLHNMYRWRNWLLRQFGASIGQDVRIRASAKFTYPWKISVGDYSWIGDGAEFYSLDKIMVGRHCVVSQNAYLCTGSHKLNEPDFSLITSPIMIKDGAWIASDVFIYPGITIHEMGVAGARSTVTKDIPYNEVHVGYPAKFLKERFQKEVSV